MSYLEYSIVVILSGSSLFNLITYLWWEAIDPSTDDLTPPQNFSLFLCVTIGTLPMSIMMIKMIYEEKERIIEKEKNFIESQKRKFKRTEI